MKKKIAFISALVLIVTMIAGCSPANDTTAADDYANPSTGSVQTEPTTPLDTTSPKQTETESNPEVEPAPEPVPEPKPAPEPEPEDDRGISGFNGSILVMLLESSYDIPSVMLESNDPDESAWRCISSLNQNGIKFAYQISLDKEKELIKASFSVSSTTQDKSVVQNAADLYFYAVAIQEYDTSEKDTLVTWMEDTVSTVDVSGASTTIGDAEFFMYSSGTSYFLDVSKTE